MSLEDVIKDLVSALDDNTKALKELLAKGSESRSSEKTAEEPSRRGRGRPRKEDKPDKVTPADVKKAYGEYLGVEDEKEYAKRREFVESVLNELGVDKISEASDEDQVRAYEWLMLKKDGKRVNFDSGANGGGRSSLV